MQQWTLDHIDLSLATNQFITILGAPGSGKSTLLQHFNGLLRAHHGSIHLLNMDIDPAPAKLPKQLTKKVGLVFQYPEQQLFSHTIWDDLLYGPLNFEMSLQEAENAAKSAAYFMGLDDSILRKSPYQLSSGQLRKAAIAAVLSAQPDMIILDEPTASLDSSSRLELMQLLYRQCHEQQRTVIVVTHALDEVMPFTDHIVVIDEGKVAYSGNPHELMKQETIITKAGLQIPAPYQLYNTLKEPLQLGELNHYPTAAELAATIKNAIK